MKRASFFAMTLSLFSMAGGFVVACKKEARPPVSNGAGVFNPSGGGSGGNDGGTSDGGLGGAFASFPGFEPTGLATDGDTVFVTLAPIDSTQPAEVARVDPAGVVTLLVTDAVSPSVPAFASGKLYYADTPSGVTTSAIMQLDLSNVGAGPQSLVSGVDHPSAILAATNALIVASNAGGTGVEVDSVSTVNGTSTPLSSVAGEFTPGGLATDTVSVYFAAVGVAGGQIESAPLNGGPADNIWTGSTGSLGGLTALGGTVYFTLDVSGGNGAVYSVPAIGGAPVAIATGLDTPTDLVLIQNYVYFTSNSPTGGIYRAFLDPEAGAPVEPVLIGGGVARLAFGATVLYGTADQALVRVR